MNAIEVEASDHGDDEEIGDIVTMRCRTSTEICYIILRPGIMAAREIQILFGCHQRHCCTARKLSGFEQGSSTVKITHHTQKSVHPVAARMPVIAALTEEFKDAERSLKYIELSVHMKRGSSAPHKGQCCMLGCAVSSRTKLYPRNVISQSKHVTVRIAEEVGWQVPIGRARGSRFGAHSHPPP